MLTPKKQHATGLFIYDAYFQRGVRVGGVLEVRDDVVRAVGVAVITRRTRPRNVLDEDQHPDETRAELS